MLRKEKNKFNIEKDKSKRTFNNITFASKLEMNYYKDVILPNVESKQISYFELQKKYELQPSFQLNGKIIKAITYVADFYVEYSNGEIEVIDTKGFPDNTAKLKRKLFWYKYPNIKYSWISYSKMDGGWILYEELKKKREERRKQRKFDNNYITPKNRK